MTHTRGEARMTLTRAVTDYFTLWDRCGGSEAIAADLFAEARQNMRDALAAQADQPDGQPQSPVKLGVDAERERCVAICEGWIGRFQDTDIKYTSAREYAIDAVDDIAELIRNGADPRDHEGTPSQREET